VERMPTELDPARLTAIIDTREQAPLDLSPLHTIAGTLATGDYSVCGLEQVVAIERKSLPDLLACVGRERARFDREVHRLAAYPVRALVIESTWPEIERGDWRGAVKPAAVLGSLVGWSATGLPLFMAGDHARAGKLVARLLYVTAKRRWREARALVAAALDGNGVAPK